MSGKRSTSRINRLMEQEDWQRARELILAELEKTPDSHWLLTQHGLTLYEEGKYKEALEVLSDSLRIRHECPLTLWNYAGALAALEKYEKAVEIYVFLMRSEETSEENPCWENKDWSASLRTDCIYRAGVCMEKLGDKEVARSCYGQYLFILSDGVKGSYSFEDVAGRIQKLDKDESVNGASVVQRAVAVTVRAFRSKKALEGRKQVLSFLPSKITFD